MLPSNNRSPHSVSDGTSPAIHNKPLKRKRSKDSMTITSVSLTAPEPTARSPILAPIILPDIRRNPDEPYVEPPSPVPTEIVEELVELSNEDHVVAAKEAGIKVRDFAYKPQPKGPRDIRAPEYWGRPLDKLVVHDRYIRLNPSSDRFGHGIPGKLLWGLLSTGLVSKEEAETNWRPGEWKAYKAYVNRPLGPYPVCLPKAFKKPTIAYRKRLLQDTFDQELSPKDLRREDDVYMPPDAPGMDEGPKHLPEPERALRRIVRAPPNTAYRTAYDMPSQQKTASKPSKSPRAPSQPRSAKSIPSRPSTPTPPASAVGHNASVDSVHVDKRRRTSGPPGLPSTGASDTPPATPPAGPSRNLGRALSRSASYSPAGSSRSETPPADEAPRRPLGRTLTRTATLSRIPVQ
ncbi:hypothetical protein LXA43DRAFT_999823 [Ganoderma leucocontextum]|nr:hypothetical protein LXA43DRAFT_999823 [Ganoderma leucocontextum]